MAQAVVEYADFSGGFFVGPRDTAQPMNTWTGENVWLDKSTGELMALNTVQRASVADGTTYTNNPPQTNLVSFPVKTAAGQMVWAQFDSGANFRFWKRDAPGGVVTRSATFAPAGGSGVQGQMPAIAPFAGVTCAWLADGNVTVIRLNIGAMTVGTTAVTAIGDSLALWNDRMVSWSSSISPFGRLYFSDANAFTTWQATSFIDIGDTATPISTVVVTPQALLIGKPSGWWEIRGTLGSTETVQQLASTNGPRLGASRANHIAGGMILYDGFERGVTTLAFVGLVPRVMNARPAFDSLGMTKTSMGGFLVGGDGNADLVNATVTDGGWIYDTLDARWHHFTIPAALMGDRVSADTLGPLWAEDTANNPTANTFGKDEIIGVMNSSALTRNEVVTMGDLRYSDPPAGLSCTVTLASHKAPVGALEAVKEVWCEVATGAVVSSGIATVSIRVQAQGVPNAPPDLAMPWSAAYEQEYFSSQLTADSRYMVRFSPSDLPYATEFVPEVTLTNLKLRRLILVVDRDTLRAS